MPPGGATPRGATSCGAAPHRGAGRPVVGRSSPLRPTAPLRRNVVRIGGPAGGIERVFHVGPQQRAARSGGTARIDSRLRARAAGSLAGDGGHRRRRRRGVDGKRAAFHVCDGTAVAGRLGGQQLIQLLEPGPLRARVRRAPESPLLLHCGTGGSGRTQALQFEPAQQADEGHQVAPRAGAAGEIEFRRARPGASSRESRIPRCAPRWS